MCGGCATVRPALEPVASRHVHGILLCRSDGGRRCPVACRIRAESAAPPQSSGPRRRSQDARGASMSPDLAFARSQMALSLAFHIVFAAVGVGMPVLMVVAEGLHLRTREPVYLDLAKRWAGGTAILFAVGAVSGTVLSFELGLLWPGFMELAGPIIGMPFSLEGFAFFTEAIFLGVYLYGWERVSPRAHLVAGILVAVSGAASGVFVVIANAWMNTPTGFTLVEGRLADIDPIAAI